MDIRTTPLWLEVTKILEQSWTPPIIGLRLDILANGKTITTLRILHMDRIRDYIGAYADETYVRVWIPAGTFIEDIYPYRSELKAVLYRDVLTGSDQSGSQPIQTQTLSALLLNQQDLAKEAQAAATSTAVANLNRVLEIDLQLTDQVLQQARLTGVGGRFRDTTTPEVLQYVMANTLAMLKNDEASEPIGLDMVESANKDVQSAIVVMDDVKLPDLGDFLHARVSGIYSAGFASYLQRNNWYIYPPFDVTRFEKAQHTLTIVNIPKNRIPSVERTYRTTGNQVVIIGTGDSRHSDLSDKSQLNDGNGVRFAQAGQFMGDLLQVKDNKALALRVDNTSEFVSSDRPEKMNNVRMSSRRVTSNTFYEMSKLAATQGSYVQVEWQNSNVDLLYPGMPVRFFYHEDGEVNQIDGVLVGVHEFSESPTPYLTYRRHIINAALTVFLQRAQLSEATST